MEGYEVKKNLLLAALLNRLYQIDSQFSVSLKNIPESLIRSPMVEQELLSPVRKKVDNKSADFDDVLDRSTSGKRACPCES